jgi:hypothetical protein
MAHLRARRFAVLAFRAREVGLKLGLGAFFAKFFAKNGGVLVNSHFAKKTRKIGVSRAKNFSLFTARRNKKETRELGEFQFNFSMIFR